MFRSKDATLRPRPSDVPGRRARGGPARRAGQGQDRRHRHRRHPAWQVPGQGEVLLGGEGRPRLLQCRARLGLERRLLRRCALHRLAHRVPRRGRAPRSVDLPPRPLGRQRRLLPGRVRGGGRCDAALHLSAPAPEDDHRPRDLQGPAARVRHGVRVVQLPRNAPVLARQRLREARAAHARHVRLLDPARRAEPPLHERAPGRAAPPSASPSKGCTRRRGPASTRRRCSTATRWRRATAPSFSRRRPRRSATASASCRASWPSGTRSCPAAPATSTSRCGTAPATTSSTTAPLPTR